MDTLVSLVAADASLIANRGWGCTILAKHPVRFWWLAATFVVEVLLALAVAIGTGRGAAIGHGAMLRLADRQNAGVKLQHRGNGFVPFVMATRAFRVAFQDQVLCGRVLDQLRPCRRNPRSRCDQCQQDSDMPR